VVSHTETRAGYRHHRFIYQARQHLQHLVRRQIHELGRRRKGPFVAVNCAAVVGTLLEAELFGIEERMAREVRGRRGKFGQADLDDLPPQVRGQHGEVLAPALAARDSMRTWASRYARLVFKRCGRNNRQMHLPQVADMLEPVMKLTPS
jgi:Sigma-54 interaction domain